MAPFDPVSALVGGALIGLAAVLLMLLNGRIAGVSGILGGAKVAPLHLRDRFALGRLGRCAGWVVRHGHGRGQTSAAPPESMWRSPKP